MRMGVTISELLIHFNSSFFIPFLFLFSISFFLYFFFALIIMGPPGSWALGPGPTGPVVNPALDILFSSSHFDTSFGENDWQMVEVWPSHDFTVIARVNTACVFMTLNFKFTACSCLESLLYVLQNALSWWLIPSSWFIDPHNLVTLPSCRFESGGHKMHTPSIGCYSGLKIQSKG